MSHSFLTEIFEIVAWMVNLWFQTAIFVRKKISSSNLLFLSFNLSFSYLELLKSPCLARPLFCVLWLLSVYAGSWLLAADIVILLGNVIMIVLSTTKYDKTSCRWWRCLLWCYFWNEYSYFIWCRRWGEFRSQCLRNGHWDFRTSFYIWRCSTHQFGPSFCEAKEVLWQRSHGQISG